VAHGPFKDLLDPTHNLPVLFVLPLLIWKLPMLICERYRLVRYLPWAGLVYCVMIVPLTAVTLNLDWIEALIWAGLIVYCCLLPNPFTFVLSPRKRRAVQRAIEYQEAKEGPKVIYGMVKVIGSEVGRTIVCIAIGDRKPPGRRFLAVGNDSPTVEELDMEYVDSKYGVTPWM
jgi:hypothetical protein